LHLLQNRLYNGLPGVRANARRLESGPPVGIPVQIRLRGDDIPTLRARAEKLKELLREQPDTERIQDNWGGEYEEQVKGFAELSMVLIISVTAIYLALLFQFKNGVKPLIVFAAIPYGMAGAFGMLYITSSPFGFMAFLGIVSLIGVIVRHIIVLFDFIEERRAEGDDLKTALLDAGIMRLRPVMITVAATVLSLIPLALHGGPLWEPLCYAQIGGLTVATFVTLLMVPVIYAIAALDLKIVD
jgi:multidrug efflux pump subunit AcrB